MVQLLQTTYQTDVGESRIPSAVQKFSGVLSTRGLLHPNWQKFSLGSTFLRIKELASRDARAHSRPVGLVNLQRACTSALISEVDDFVHRMEELFRLLGIEWTLEIEEGFHEKFLWLGLQDLIIPTLKIACNLVFTDHYDLDPPAIPDYLVGIVREIWPYSFRNRFSQMGQKRYRLSRESQWAVYTVFQGLKKSMLPLRPEAILDSLVKHKRALTSDGSFSGDKGRVEMIVVRLLSRLGVVPYTGNIQNVSTKSTRQSGLAQRGQVGLAIRKLDEEHGLSFFLGRLQNEFLGFKSDDRTGIPIYGPFLDLGVIAEKLYSFSPDGKKDYQAAPCIVLEPMKARIITKPDAGDYVPLNCLQADIWKRLQNRFPCFDLIGRPISVEDVESRFSYLRETVQELDWGFVSGDYSAATDNLKSEVTRMIAERLFESTRFSDPNVYERIMDTLYSTTVRWDETSLPTKRECPWISIYDKLFNRKTRDRDEDEQDLNEYLLEQRGLSAGKQTNGQLMGHVLSFLLLCLANLTAYLYAWETYNRFPRGSFPDYLLDRVLINGDDILFAAERGFYDHWLETVQLFGFVPSVGKNLFSREICQINSVLYSFHPRKDTKMNPIRKANLVYPEAEYYNILGGFSSVAVREVPYVNMGILVGRKKGDSRGGYADSITRVLPNQIQADGSRASDTSPVPPIIKIVKSLPQLYSYTHDFAPKSMLKNVDESMKVVLGLFSERFPALREPFQHLQYDQSQLNFDGVSRKEYIQRVISGLTYIEAPYEKGLRSDCYSKYLPDQEDISAFTRVFRQLESERKKCQSFIDMERRGEKVESVFRDSRVTWSMVRRGALTAM